MSQRDYVKRGRAPKKKPVEKKQAPLINVIIAVIVIVGFIIILWRIKDNAPTPDNVSIEEPAIVEQPIKEDDLPELPEEEWDFIQTLPGYEVEIEEAQQTESDKRYLMQCGSFRSASQAEEMRAQIAFIGLEAMVRPSDGDNGRWYRVILGPFDSKRNAERDRHSIQRIGIRTCQIWFWNL